MVKQIQAYLIDLENTAPSNNTGSYNREIPHHSMSATDKVEEYAPARSCELPEGRDATPCLELQELQLRMVADREQHYQDIADMQTHMERVIANTPVTRAR